MIGEIAKPTGSEHDTNRAALVLAVHRELHHALLHHVVLAVHLV
jgi:hypothetical protein